MNTKISYLYRDAGNYKRYNECIIAGALSAKQIRAILDCCDMGEYFIPRQVGLPALRYLRSASRLLLARADCGQLLGNERIAYDSPYRHGVGQPLRGMQKQLAG